MFGLFKNAMNVTPEEAQQMLSSDNPPKLVDVRGPSEWATGMIQGALKLNDALMKEMLEKWDKETPILCYCAHGVRSMQMAAFLQGKGFNQVKSLQGGIAAWGQRKRA
ncbi:MAG: rhodanese-like domain-containing protein [Deltaproteobacteria bacterium]|nr:rhodanese-like domain-containing protein [Deltaproteobacteria bacterium]